MAAPSIPISITLPISERVFSKMKTFGKPDAILKEIVDVLEEWAGMETLNDNGLDTSHIACGNKRIERKICLHHRKTKKRGCGSCQTGKIIQKIAEFELQLQELEKRKLSNKYGGKNK